MLKRFTKVRYLVLAILALALFAGAASAFSPNPHELRKYEALFSGARAAGEGTAAEHAEKIIAAGEKLYGLSTSVDIAGGYGNYTYFASEIVEFDRELNELRSVELKDADGNVGRNATKMAYHDGKLYVACMGGNQSAGTFGDFWVVDTAVMTAKRVLDTRTIAALSDLPDVLPYGISIAGDGTAFLICLAYAEDFTASVKLFVTDVTKLSAGDAGTPFDLVGSGYSWDVQYDDNAGVLWCVAGSALQARDKTGALLRTFTPADLGNNVGTIAPLDDTGAGSPGLFYTAVADDYSAGSTGIITKDAAAFTVRQLAAGYGSDIQGYAFKDHNGAGRVLVRENLDSGVDSLYVWDIKDWSRPIVNTAGDSMNIHDAAADGPYLYLAAYGSVARDGTLSVNGEFIRLDMKNGYARYVTDDNIGMTSKPVLPAGASSDIEPYFMSPVDSAVFVASSDFAAGDLVPDDSAGTVVLRDDVATAFAETLLESGSLKGTGIAAVTPLPVFTVSMEAEKAGKIAAVEFSVLGDALGAGRAADVQLMKVRGRNADTAEPLVFKYAAAPSDYADGTFTVRLDSAAAGDLTATESYKLVLFIKDGGSYDLDGEENAVVLDPAVIVKASSGGSGGGGGCDMGGGALVLLGAVALFRQARRCGQKK